MARESLSDAVGRLLVDRRFQRRFRRDPEGTLGRLGLSPAEIEAVKEGRAEDLLALGLDPELVWPSMPSGRPLQAWLGRNAKRLSPVAAVVVATVAFMPATAQAASMPAARRRVAGRAMRALGVNRIVAARALKATPRARALKAGPRARAMRARSRI